MRAVPLLHVCLGLLPELSRGWVSIAQSRYGAQLAAIRNASRGIVSEPLSKSLGHLWTFPSDPLSSRGLGGAITYAVDKKLCDEIMGVMEEDFWEISFVDCDDVRATLHRAFESWASHHRLIQFVDVTEECEKRGSEAWECTLAEIWVTSMNSTAPNFEGLPSAGLSAPAQAVAYPEVTPSFRSTNGLSPFVRIGETSVARQVVETTGGRLSFNTAEPYCWYLDSNFCGGWHNLKSEYGEGVVYVFSLTLLFALWGVAMGAVLLHFASALRRVLKKHGELRDDLDPLCGRMCKAFLLTVDSLGVYAVCLRFFVGLLPWAFYKASLRTCWKCYDFEAVAAHEIGHLLGLGQPDLLPSEVMCPNPDPKPNASGLLPSQVVASLAPAGENSYSWLLAEGGELNSSTCSYPWDHVMAGLPPFLPQDQIDPVTGNRYALMNSIDKHRPRRCLADDDLEALNTLYPTCAGAVTVVTCPRQPLIFLGC
ncbi:MAG: hypothetical protein SGPRY_009608 [Prymnesium sp.]